MNCVDVLPTLGAGLAYRTELARDIERHGTGVDWLECMTEHFLNCPPEISERLGALCRRFRVVPHGVELSIGGTGGPDWRYVDSVAELVASVDAPWFSDHLCYTRAGDVTLGTLVPLPRTRAVARRTAQMADRVRRRVGVPLLLENITYYLDVGGELTEAEFLTEVLEHCECGLLLDLTNVAINATNHGFDPLEFLDAIPLERVVQLHLAGGERRGDLIVDSHSSAVPDDVWSLFDYVAERAPVNGVIIERDQTFPADFEDLLQELARARAVLSSPRLVGP